MTNDLAIRVTNLSKRYKIYNSPRELIFDFIGLKTTSKEKWALKDLNFEIKRGEVVGVMGRNGAGKSTLLKILSGIIPATTGEVLINGKVSSILELGTGFHPEYTGRDNIIMGGMCLGMSRDEVLGKIEAIIDFSELREYIDQPFKTYSSGMKSRLTFATAISIEPDILIIDEALAAGDGFFVSKCLKRIKEICNSGATVLFVSHSSDLVRRLCSRGILINNGILEKIGDVNEICNFYDSLILEAASLATQLTASSDSKKFSSDVMKILSLKVLDEEGTECNAFYQYSKVNIEVEIESTIKHKNPGLWVKFMRFDGVLATSWFSHEPEFVDTGSILEGCNKIKFSIDRILLGDGSYSLGVGIFPFKEGVESVLYNDPFCLWDGGTSITIKRKGRPLSTLFDQPVSASISQNLNLINT